MKNLYLLGTTLSNKVGSAQSRDARCEESKALRESLEREHVRVLVEELLTPKQEPQPVIEIEPQPRGKRATQHDDLEST